MPRSSCFRRHTLPDDEWDHRRTIDLRGQDRPRTPDRFGQIGRGSCDSTAPRPSARPSSTIRNSRTLSPLRRPKHRVHQSCSAAKPLLRRFVDEQLEQGPWVPRKRKPLESLWLMARRPLRRHQLKERPHRWHQERLPPPKSRQWHRAPDGSKSSVTGMLGLKSRL